MRSKEMLKQVKEPISRLKKQNHQKLAHSAKEGIQLSNFKRLERPQKKIKLDDCRKIPRWYACHGFYATPDYIYVLSK